MKVPVFISHPTPHLYSQMRFLEEFKADLISRGFEPLTLGPESSYDYDAPLVGIRRILTHCCGLVSVAFRRTHVASATKYLGADIVGRAQEPSSDFWFTSPYCQIEPAMAFQLGLPILILREEGVLPEGVLEKGVTGLYLPEFRLDAATSFIGGEECRRLLDQWGGYVRTVYKRRGDPPALFT
ncbi:MULTISPECIES: hypothetical protein [Mameliella]|uniref:hypothetical protein n=1 Tax=Mameliella TaxID=1434019 RepID=UPI0010547E21|nr:MULTISPECIES: hypothetical protein [Mameliella]MCR9272540.1 hypothetical protein [Paracoccaceae bacterium]